MKIKTILHCPDCQGTKIKRNAKKPCGTQNYLCKKCRRQFVGGQALRYKACHSSPAQKILLPLVYGIGIRNTAKIENQHQKTIASFTTLPAYDPAQAAVL
ncbi:MAG: hypothetical protein LBL90_14005 [Prevotellaceae bacterium]|jgi:transposase-like protein|nr:hypothetical protein [Prevotellaceae bacterium]